MAQATITPEQELEYNRQYNYVKRRASSGVHEQDLSDQSEEGEADAGENIGRIYGNPANTPRVNLSLAGAQAAVPRQENTPTTDEEEDDEEDEDEENEAVRKRTLEFEKNRSKVYRRRVKKLIEDKIKKQIAARTSIRLVNALFGITGIGLIVTFFIMSFQAICGNILRIKGVVKLEGIEMGIWIILCLALMALYIFILMLVSLFSDPWKAGVTLISDALSSLFGNN